MSAVESSQKKYHFDIKELQLNSRMDSSSRMESSLATFGRCELNNLARNKADELADRPHFFPSVTVLVLKCRAPNFRDSDN